MTTLGGRIALVTGAASGIGRELALELTRRGARVVAWDLTGDAPPGAAGYACDVTDRAQVYETADRVRAEVGEVDVLVNNAGIVTGRALLDTPDDQIEKTFQVNTISHFWTVKAFLPSMVERGAGHVVTVASAAGLIGVARQTDYAASKHAAVGFDEALHFELKDAAPGVTTTVVCPYYIGTGMFTGVRTRFPWLLPILEQTDVARRIADAIEHDRRSVIMPPAVHALRLLRLLPSGLFDRAVDLLGLNHGMDAFVGHAAEEAQRSA